jgi:hypothetical protein
MSWEITSSEVSLVLLELGKPEHSDASEADV